MKIFAKLIYTLKIIFESGGNGNNKIWYIY